MRRFHLKVTPSLVISFLALFVALGGTAAASVMITSNKQVAKNTIAGHAPVGSNHPNVIAGSINGTDLSSAYASSLKVHCPTNLILAGDLCVETALRPAATYTQALSTCASAGRRLPDDGELALAFDHLGAPQDVQWVGEHFTVTEQGVTALEVGGLMDEDASRTITIAWNGATVLDPFRCVVSPMN